MAGSWEETFHCHNIKILLVKQVMMSTRHLSTTVTSVGGVQLCLGMDCGVWWALDEALQHLGSVGGP